MEEIIEPIDTPFELEEHEEKQVNIDIHV